MSNKALFEKWIVFATSFQHMKHELTINVKSDLITPVQYSILEYISVNQPVTPSEISDCQHISMPNTSRELKKLIDKKLIEKFRNAGDRRKQHIRLSNEGEEMMRKAFACIESRFLNQLKSASDKDIEDINNALDILQTKLFN